MSAKWALSLVGAAALIALTACANQAPVADQTPLQTVTAPAAAAPGQTACADLSATHLLILIQAQALIVSEGHGATDDTGWITELNSDAASSPAQLSASIKGLAATVTSIQAGTGVPANDGTIGNVGAIASYCASHGFQVPAISE